MTLPDDLILNAADEVTIRQNLLLVSLGKRPADLAIEVPVSDSDVFDGDVDGGDALDLGYGVVDLIFVYRREAAACCGGENCCCTDAKECCASGDHFS